MCILNCRRHKDLIILDEEEEERDTWKNFEFSKAYYCQKKYMVRRTGLEPARLPALEPKSSASAISPPAQKKELGYCGKSKEFPIHL